MHYSREADYADGHIWMVIFVSKYGTGRHGPSIRIYYSREADYADGHICEWKFSYKNTVLEGMAHPYVYIIRVKQIMPMVTFEW